MPIFKTIKDLGAATSVAEETLIEIQSPSGSATEKATVEQLMEATGFGSRLDLIDQFSVRSTAVASAETLATAMTDGKQFRAGDLWYRRVEGATVIDDLPGFVPAGDVHVGHFGVVAGDRDAARDNVLRLNAALAWCLDNQFDLDAGFGTFFLSGTVINNGVVVKGRGTGLWMEQPIALNGYKAAAPTQWVWISEDWPAEDLFKVHGVSSCRALGASRTLPLQRNGAAWVADDHVDWYGFYEQHWHMVGFTDAAGGDDVGVAAPLKVGVRIVGPRAVFSNIRMMPDGGGDDGMTAYLDETHGMLIGDLDVGILQMGGHSCAYHDVQVVGHWRRAGCAVVAIDPDEDYSDYTAPYETKFSGQCRFEGMRGMILAGPDRWPVLDYTASTVDLPWADDHPWTLDEGHNILRLTDRGTGTSSGAAYTYTGVEKANVEYDTGLFEDRIRLTGLINVNTELADFTLDYINSAGNPAVWSAIVNSTSGGANSHIGGEMSIHGLTLPNGYPVNASFNPNGGAQITDNGAIGGLQVSGWRVAEEDITARIQHSGSVGLYKHSGHSAAYSFIMEGNPQTLEPFLVGESGDRRAHIVHGMMNIVSPSFNVSSHVARPEYAAGGPRRIDWRTWGEYEFTSAVVDYTPAIPFIPRPPAWQNALPGAGWMEGLTIQRPVTVEISADGAGGYTRNQAAVPALLVGPDAEGPSGFNPDGLIHARAVTGQAKVTIETVEDGMDPLIQLLGGPSTILIRSDVSTGSDLSIIAQAEGTVDGVVTTINTELLRYNVSAGAVSARIRSNNHFAEMAVRSYRNSSGNHAVIAGEAGYGVVGSTLTPPARMGGANAPILSIDARVYDGASTMLSQGGLTWLTTTAHGAANYGTWAKLELTPDGSTTKATAVEFHLTGAGGEVRAAVHGFSATVFDTSGSGSPEGVVTAGIGSTYRDTASGALYMKQSGTGNTGWQSLGDNRQVISSPVDGATYNIVASTARRIEVYMLNSGTLAAYTVNLPTLLDGQEIHFYWWGAITTFTMNAAGGQTLAVAATTVAANGRASWKYLAAATRIFRKT